MKIIVKNKSGIHARPASKISSIVCAHQSKVEIFKKDQKADASSVIEILMLAIECAEEITIKAKGPDEEEVILKLYEFINNDFDA